MGKVLTGMYISEARRRTREMVVTEASDAAYLDHKSRAAIMARTIAAESRDDGAIVLHLINSDWVLYERGGVQTSRDIATTTEQTGA